MNTRHLPKGECYTGNWVVEFQCEGCGYWYRFDLFTLFIRTPGLLLVCEWCGKEERIEKMR